MSWSEAIAWVIATPFILIIAAAVYFLVWAG